MKNYILFFAFISLFCGCTKQSDNRDRFVGEYKLYIAEEKWGERKGGDQWSYYTRTYDMEFWCDSMKIDSSLTLVVRKVDYDTVSVVFDLVAPFNFQYQQRVIAQNEEIKKRNKESLCGPDEPLKEVPVPTYSKDRTLCASYDGYVQGHKIFLNNYETRKQYYKGAYSDIEVSYDSVFLRNDTIRFIRKTKTNTYYENGFDHWMVELERCYGVKL